MKEQYPAQNKNSQESLDTSQEFLDQKQALLGAFADPDKRSILVESRKAELAIEHAARLELSSRIQEDPEPSFGARSLDQIRADVSRESSKRQRASNKRESLESTLKKEMLEARKTTLELASTTANQLLGAGVKPEVQIHNLHILTEKKWFKFHMDNYKLSQKVKKKVIGAPLENLKGGSLGGWILDQKKSGLTTILCTDGRLLTGIGEVSEKEDSSVFSTQQNQDPVKGVVKLPDHKGKAKKTEIVVRGDQTFRSFLDENLESDLALYPLPNPTFTKAGFALKREVFIQDKLCGLMIENGVLLDEALKPKSTIKESGHNNEPSGVIEVDDESDEEQEEPIEYRLGEEVSIRADDGSEDAGWQIWAHTPIEGYIEVARFNSESGELESVKKVSIDELREFNSD